MQEEELTDESMIARIVGVPLPTAKSRLKRGMAKLKEILEKEGVTHEG